MAFAHCNVFAEREIEKKIKIEKQVFDEKDAEVFRSLLCRTC